MFRVLYLLGLFLSVNSAAAPFIKPCKNGDSACVLASAKAAVPFFLSGVPELGISPMDPMHIDVIKSDQGGLQLLFKDTIMTGIKSCSFETVKHDLVKMKQIITMKCNLKLKGNYKLSGQLLILPVQGNGEYSINIRDIVIKVVSELTTVTGADGKPHWHIKKWKDSYNVQTGASFAFENLFNGNNALAQPVLEFANSNWKDVMQEIAPPIVHAILERIVAGVEALYKAVPAEELNLA
ncbi:circadian clock-controlled protein daywake-like [Colias croceus]|uniref:circadian clock-controlled protein daywake-like n=1 Tax=Colias crocea TaxID=72248 RepID=UPI001E27F0D4|nr:circadian clock-controlled protein daywake-like [Colias croceus]